MANIIFEKYPHLNRGHRRLSVKGVMGIDHVNPKSWVGDTTVGAVDLEREWASGRELATSILEKYFAASDVSMIVDFDKAFRVGSGADLLQPLGKVVGVSLTADDDRSEVENSAFLDAGNTEANTRPSVAVNYPGFDDFSTAKDPGTDIDSSTDSETAPTDSDTEVESPGDLAGPSSTAGSTPRDTDTTHTVVNSHCDSPTHSDEPEPKNPSILDCVEIVNVEKLSDGENPIEANVPRVALEDLGTRSKFSNDSPDLSGDGDSIMRTNDVAACLVRTRGGIALAVIVVLGFRVGSAKELQHSIGLDDLEDPKKSVKVTCQVLEMNQLRADNTYHWQWSGNYVNILPTNKTSVAQRHYIFEVPGTFILPLGPQVAWREVVTPTGVAGHELTWLVAETELSDALEDGWSLLNPEDPDELLGYVFLLPYIDWEDINLPYINNTGWFDCTHRVFTG
ncbi:hypothetical protein AAF712_009168 [Marasmius tenuissimus]|uniref:Uncharacterized protein n=1 Tax=Marasmius tenuissimus TaxID=585030 RepID=A0ABR2ZQD1_9AGAR